MKNAELIDLKNKPYTQMICYKCNIERGDDFRPNAKQCRLCSNESAKRTRQKAEIKKKPAFITCSVCKENKTEFRINRLKCLDCERASGRQYRRENPEKGRDWIENNRAKQATLVREWQGKQRKENPNWNHMANHRTAVRSIIINGKNRSKYVDCNGDRLRDWVAFQAHITAPDINIQDPDNSTKWVIDHVIPCKLFLDGEYSKGIVLSWVNIQPVPVEYNKSKHMNVDKEQMKAHLRLVQDYCKSHKIKSVDTYIETLKTLCETP